MGLLSIAVRSLGRAAVALLVSGCSLSVVDGLAGGGKSDGGSPDGSTAKDGAVDRSVFDAPSLGGDAAADRSADMRAEQAGRDGVPSDAVPEVDDDGPTEDIDPSDAADELPDSADGDAIAADVEGDADGDVDGRSTCGCTGDGYCMGTECVYSTCLTRLQAMPGTPSGVAWIDPDGDGDAGEPPYRAYCEMVADGGGWTLVLKVDGAETRFLNHSSLWENDTTYRPEYPDFDTNEAKLASYNGVAFTSVRVGMREDATTRWLVIPTAAASFLDLMRSGYRATTLGRAAWKSLPASGSLQTFCGREGFNVTTPGQAAVRIGIVGNEFDNCTSCDSWIGFGGEVMGLGYACGNVARWQPDNGDRDLRLFGYVMVR